MKIKNIALGFAGMAFLASCQENSSTQQDAGSASTAQMNSLEDSISYAISQSLITMLDSKGFEYNSEMATKALNDIRNKTEAFDKNETQDLAGQGYNWDKLLAAKDALTEGLAFLEENAKKEGVITTETGLQYKVIREGNGEFPDSNDNVQVNYEGSLIDGTVFDSSYKRGKPIAFGLNEVVPGWTEGIQKMSIGGEIELYIPYQLGYGERGNPSAKIPGNSVLLFKVELLDFDKVD